MARIVDYLDALHKDAQNVNCLRVHASKDLSEELTACEQPYSVRGDDPNTWSAGSRRVSPGTIATVFTVAPRDSPWVFSS